MRLLLAARLSVGKGQTGIQTQDLHSREWGEREGHTIIAVAADRRSGIVAPWDRPNLKPWVTQPQLMAKYDGIVAYKNDRLSRGDRADEARIRLWAQDNGKVLMIADGPQWPPRHDGDKWAWKRWRTKPGKSGKPLGSVASALSVTCAQTATWWGIPVRLPGCLRRTVREKEARNVTTTRPWNRSPGSSRT